MVSFDDAQLFAGQPLTKFLEQRLNSALDAVTALTSADIAAAHDASRSELDRAGDRSGAIIDSVLTTFRIEPVNVDFAAAESTEWSEVDNIIATSIVVPFTGEARLWQMSINHRSPSGHDLRGGGEASSRGGVQDECPHDLFVGGVFQDVRLCRACLSSARPRGRLELRRRRLQDGSEKPTFGTLLSSC